MADSAATSLGAIDDLAAPPAAPPAQRATRGRRAINSLRPTRAIQPSANAFRIQVITGDAPGWVGGSIATTSKGSEASRRPRVVATR